MIFSTEILGCYWQDARGQWIVKLRQHVPGQEPREYEDYCDVLIHAAGILHNWKVSQQELT